MAILQVTVNPVKTLLDEKCLKQTLCKNSSAKLKEYCIPLHQTPQSPLVRPVAHDELSVDNYALGTNAVVAVISYTVCAIRS